MCKSKRRWTWLLLGALTMFLAAPVVADDHERDEKHEKHEKHEGRDDDRRSHQAYVKVTKARWKAEKSRLEVKAKGRWPGAGKGYRQVQILDADSGDILASRRVKVEDKGKWKLEAKLRLSSSVPCRIRVVAGDLVAERDVQYAPADCGGGQTGNQPPVANAGPDRTYTLAVGALGIDVTLDGSGSSDPDGQVASWTWMGTPDPADVVKPTVHLGEGTYVFTLIVRDDQGAPSAPDAVTITVKAAQAGGGDVSINSTATNTSDAHSPVPEQPFLNDGRFALLASNDLGMHCADLDYRVFSILPPFNVVHAQVVKKGVNGQEPSLQDDSTLELVYSAVSNPQDPALSKLPSIDVFKSNFWEDPNGDGRTLGYDAYAPLYFGLLKPGDVTQHDLGIPVPDSILLRGCLQDYLAGNEGIDGPRSKCGLGQQALPGKDDPYAINQPQPFGRFDREINFFNELLGGVGLGGIITETNWWAADGVPMSPVDDAGRRNAYPLMRVQAIEKSSGQVVATTDVVLPVASEADCQNCHAPVLDCADTAAQTGLDIQCNGSAIERTSFDVMTLSGDSQGNMPPGDTPLETLSNVAKINILRVHDAKHGTDLDQRRPIQCSTCHYSPALDLAQLGPVDSPQTEQRGHNTMSRVMHAFHGELKDDQGNPLFPDMPAPGNRDSQQVADLLNQTCYQCHPGKRTQCLRGAMAKGGVVCQDCHGDMRHVGNDFSGEMSPDNPWPGGANLSKRVPWASEPKCQACHTGDAMDNLVGQVSVPVAADGIRLLQAYTVQPGVDSSGAPDGTEVAKVTLASNKRFAENETLYRLSKGHGGVMCEGCHGATHAVFPNPIDAANDNVAAKQLQGHAGTIIECTTCHEQGSLGLTLKGPHGMHPVADRHWNKEHEDVAERNKNACRACHGRNGEGTVLSRTAAPRTLICKNSKGSWCRSGQREVSVPAGTEVGCANCHENEL